MATKTLRPPPRKRSSRPALLAVAVGLLFLGIAAFAAGHKRVSVERSRAMSVPPNFVLAILEDPARAPSWLAWLQSEQQAAQLSGPRGGAGAHAHWEDDCELSVISSKPGEPVELALHPSHGAAPIALRVSVSLTIDGSRATAIAEQRLNFWASFVALIQAPGKGYAEKLDQSLELLAQLAKADQERIQKLEESERSAPLTMSESRRSPSSWSWSSPAPAPPARSPQAAAHSAGRVDSIPSSGPPQAVDESGAPHFATPHEAEAHGY